MANNYFDFLEQNAQQEKPANDAPQNDGTVNLTVRADAECQVVCDGDFLFLLNANQIIKEKAPVGQHILQFISIDYPEISIDKIVDFPEAGKSYVVIVNEFKAQVADFKKKEAERKAKEEAERIVTMAFTSKQGAKGTYTGHVKDGKPEGKGKVVFESGGVYEGDFHNGWRHGKGYDKSSDGDIYEGDFSEDTRTGKGKLSKPDGRVWEGEFLNGESHGKAKFYYSKGDTLEGIWENGAIANKPNVYTWANGDRLECEGWDGGSHGKGVYYWKDGRKKEEIWSHGKRVKEVNGHEYVDLGLSVKWATCNVGASFPSDYGSYFAWGETTPKSEYSWANLRYCCADKMVNPFTKYNYEDNKSSLELGDDAARANWGGSWRMPTDAEWLELRQKCTWIWTEQGGKKGYKVTSKVNGNSIFLPAAGNRGGTNLNVEGSDGSYWSSSLFTNYPTDAWCVVFDSDNVFRGRTNRFCGNSVRPVTE